MSWPSGEILTPRSVGPDRSGAANRRSSGEFPAAPVQRAGPANSAASARQRCAETKRNRGAPDRRARRRLLHCRQIHLREFRDGHQSSLPVRRLAERTRSSLLRRMRDAAARPQTAAAARAPRSSSIPPPRAATSSTIYHGVSVADPYRWFEDADAQATRDWVDRARTRWRSPISRRCRSAPGSANGSSSCGPTNASACRSAKAAGISTCATTARRTRACCTSPTRSNAPPRVLVDPNGKRDDATIALSQW